MAVDGKPIAIQAADVVVTFQGRSAVNIEAGGCSLGTATFKLEDGRMANVEMGPVIMECQRTNPEAHQAMVALINDRPQVSGGGSRLELKSSHVMVVVETDSGGLQVAVQSDENFRGSTSSLQGLKPSTVLISSPGALSPDGAVAAVQLEQCQIYGGFSYAAGQALIKIPIRPGDVACPAGSASDRIAERFFDQGADVKRDGNQLVLSNSQGDLRLELVQ